MSTYSIHQGNNAGIEAQYSISTIRIIIQGRQLNQYIVNALPQEHKKGPKRWHDKCIRCVRKNYTNSMVRIHTIVTPSSNTPTASIKNHVNKTSLNQAITSQQTQIGIAVTSSTGRVKRKTCERIQCNSSVLIASSNNNSSNLASRGLEKAK